MVYQLLKTAIEQKNSFMSNEMIQLQIEFFQSVNKITEAEATELREQLNPTPKEIAEITE